jgi:uncharacterized protein DUF6064
MADRPVPNVALGWTVKRGFFQPENHRMRLPFTIDQFLEVFRRYNLTVWPAQWVLVTLGLLAVLLALSEWRSGARCVSAILALMWFWMAAAYHLAFFSDVNRAAVGFAAAFAVQGTLFAWLAFRAPAITYRPRSTVATIVGAILIVYGVVAYPVLGHVLGHRYPSAPTFGVPCPTTIFTLGLVVWADTSLPRRILIIPLAWCVVGISAAITLGMIEDFGLLIAAVATLLARGVRRGDDRSSRLVPPSVTEQCCDARARQ